MAKENGQANMDPKSELSLVLNRMSQTVVDFTSFTPNRAATLIDLWPGYANRRDPDSMGILSIFVQSIDPSMLLSLKKAIS
jgi:hypothetical protein